MMEATCRVATRQVLAIGNSGQSYLDLRDLRRIRSKYAATSVMFITKASNLIERVAGYSSDVSLLRSGVCSSVDCGVCLLLHARDLFLIISSRAWSIAKTAVLALSCLTEVILGFQCFCGVLRLWGDSVLGLQGSSLLQTSFFSGQCNGCRGALQDNCRVDSVALVQRMAEVPCKITVVWTVWNLFFGWQGCTARYLSYGQCGICSARGGGDISAICFSILVDCRRH